MNFIHKGRIMTNINHEYPEYIDGTLSGETTDKIKTLRHYQAMALEAQTMALEAIEERMQALTDVELAQACQTHSTGFPLICELARRLERYTQLIGKTIQEQQK